MTIRVVIIEDQTLVRSGIRSLLGLSEAVEVVGEAGDGAQGLRLIAETDPDVALLDLRMPVLDGLATLRALPGPRPAVLVLTTFDDEDAVVDALRAGARGYLLKDVTLDQLVDAIVAVEAGGTAIQPGITDTLLRRIGDQPTRFESFSRPEPLTPREVEISVCSPRDSRTARSQPRFTSAKARSRTTCPPSSRSSGSGTEPAPRCAGSSWASSPASRTDRSRLVCDRPRSGSDRR